MSDSDRSRQARREFIRTHHPDRGGDVEAFRSGLARFDQPGLTRPRLHVIVIPDRPWHRRLAQAFATHLLRRAHPPRVR
ncbi:MAG: hypothetical protein INR66_21900 [Gordonia polyisoprenivorans]|nr:hypothetical protein [Gordonia polyisoprenivorans]